MNEKQQSLTLKAFLLLVRTMRGMPLVHRAVWRTRKSYNALKRAILVKRPIVDATPLLKQALMEGKPYAAGKMGSLECATAACSMRRDKSRQKGQTPVEYPPYLFHSLYLNAGVFPQTEAAYDAFCQRFLQAVSACDMLVSWDVAGEAEILSCHAPRATLVRFRTLEPFFSAEPWTAALAGKRVLVISPFAQSISQQYAQRDRLWDNPSMLPVFTLKTIVPPLSAGLVPPQDADWFAAVDRLTKAMDQTPYDVALIGAGAFSLPLAAHAKRRGKIGIHLGGSLQMLFGVAGGRWEKDAAYRGFIKANWRHPSPDETPPTAKTIEGGCYW